MDMLVLDGLVLPDALRPPFFLNDTAFVVDVSGCLQNKFSKTGRKHANNGKDRLVEQGIMFFSYRFKQQDMQSPRYTKPPISPSRSDSKHTISTEWVVSNALTGKLLATR